MNAGEIFVVDDNPNNLSLLSGILRGGGYRVRMIDHGGRALKAIASSPPDLVLLDVTMPEIDGYEVCRRLKSAPETASIPVLFISALDDPANKVEGFRAGGVDYVTKPFQAEEVLARVASHIQIARLQRETDARNAELRDALQDVRRSREDLKRAQETIARLSEPGRSEDTRSWARARALEIATALGISEIGVFRLERNALLDFIAEKAEPEPWDAADVLDRGKTPDGRLVFPVPGAYGQPLGALTADARGLGLGEVERQVVVSFGRHLGTALELSELRRRLAAAESRRDATRRELRSQGYECAALCPRCGRCWAESVRGESRCPEDGEALDGTRMLPLLVQSRHRLVSLLGEGGMGTVFRARDETLSRDVAIKIIGRHHTSDPSFSTRLMREAQVLARMRHPGIIELHDAGELPDGSAFLVMELLEGRDLEAVVGCFGRATPRQVARLLRQTGGALSAVHRLGVIHRDIKPANIFLVKGEDGFDTKVMDFGLARTLHGDGSLTATGLIVGTPSYMPPEQASNAAVDERADLYALAAVAYEVLLGRRVVRGLQLVDILVELLYSLPAKPSSLRAGLTPDIDDAFLQALAKKPADRPRDVAAWASELASLLEAVPAADGWPAAPWERGS